MLATDIYFICLKVIGCLNKSQTVETVEEEKSCLFYVYREALIA